MGTDIRPMNAEEFAVRIADEATVALTGSGIFLEADCLFSALETSFLSTGHPRDLTIVHALGIGDGRDSGLSRFAHKGMVRRVIGGHWSWSPTMQLLAREGHIAAYSFPAGVIDTASRGRSEPARGDHARGPWDFCGSESRWRALQRTGEGSIGRDCLIRWTRVSPLQAAQDRCRPGARH